MLMGSGELGKEIAIELQRFGIEVIAVDRYDHAPAMQIAHRSHVINMLDGDAVEKVVREERPALVIPEIEAIATDRLEQLEKEGITRVIPTSSATLITMDRERIRTLAHDKLGLKTSNYRFAETKEEFLKAVDEIGVPCVVKPVMSSSGRGQSVVREREKALDAWDIAHEEGRGKKSKVIVEEFLKFDYEITELTVSAVDGIHFCEPIGHRQENGDYRESWQPRAMKPELLTLLTEARSISRKIVAELGGWGIFGVEMFVRGNEVIFSEVSPRPHDTGLVTLISQNLSEFALHVRAVLGLPVGQIIQEGPSASAVILGDGDSDNIRFDGVKDAFSAVPDCQIRLFGKPEIHGGRRLGVVLTRGSTVEDAVKKAKLAASKIKIIY